MEFSKKDLRTFDVVTYQDREKRTVYLNTPGGDILCDPNGEQMNNLKHYDEYLKSTICVSETNIVKVTRDGETIWERKELPVGAPYTFNDGIVLWYIDKNTAFGFRAGGSWREKGNAAKLNSESMQPFPREEWDKLMIAEAEKRGFVKGVRVHSLLYDCPHICELPVFKMKNNGELWFGGNLIFNASTATWAEIIEPKSELDKAIERVKELSGANHVQICFDKKEDACG